MLNNQCSLDVVRLDSDVHVPGYLKERLHGIAQRTLQRFNTHFGGMRMHVHLKPEGSQVGCHVNLVTDHGQYVAKSCDWDLHRAFDDAIESVEAQLERHLGKHTHQLAH